MPKITLNKQEYNIRDGEYEIQPHAEYNNLILRKDLGRLEREAGLLTDIATDIKKGNLYVVGWTHGGFLPIECAKAFDTVYVDGLPYSALSTLPVKNVFPAARPPENPIAIYVSPGCIPNSLLLPSAFVLAEHHIVKNLEHPHKIPLADSGMTLCIPAFYERLFAREFNYYFKEDGSFAYDNLINLCIMVKNAGPLFEKVLTENLPFIDRWTILDTGSTDETIDIIKKVLVGKKKGNLYQEPFINFRDSRNRCLNLAGKTCKYTIMLDDTYALRGNVRSFLNLVRGDQFADSYSLLILSDDSEYYSNRVLKTKNELRYIYTIHEVIQKEDNVTVVIPKEEAWIHDHRADYMEKRTMNRKQYDLQLLYEMHEAEPENPRHLYYLAQTYNCIDDYENAAIWFEKRATSKLDGHIQEAVDSYFELARIYNFKMNKPWPLCEETYKKAYELDPTRPDPLYFIGIHYFMEGNKSIAFDYFKKAFALGYPIHAQFSLKPTLSYHFLPKFLAQLCYEFNDHRLGLAACERFLSKAKQTDDSYSIMVDWYKIFSNLVKMPPISDRPELPKKPQFVFVADGNWNEWTGSDILTKGLGGSETYIVELARYIQAEGTFDVTVFCRTSKLDMFEGVKYRPIDEFHSTVATTKIHTCIISRYSEYLPVAITGHAENIYLVLHDLGPTGQIIPMHPKLKKIFCLTDWHVRYFLKDFPQCADRTESFYYGIDNNRFMKKAKKPNSFIYSSFPNRGLLELLKMWPKIKEQFPDATLDVFADINGKWVNEVAPVEMDAIRVLLRRGLPGVNMRGWVSKQELADAWATADIWFYPTNFKETFCLTALEAAASGTLAVTTYLAALEETVADRGVLIPGDSTSSEWQDKALSELFAVMKDSERKNRLIARNKEWADSMSWKSRAHAMLDKYIRPTLGIGYMPPIVEEEKINNGGMFGWQNDLPAGQGEKEMFERILDLHKNQKARILEVGTYAGTSLIAMMNRLPDSTGVAIDRWENYTEKTDFGIVDEVATIKERQIEQLFYNNMKIAGLTNRIKAYRGDSVDKLLELVEKKEKFNFIYVDGSHKCLDCYTDMVLSWKLLDIGGTLAVDDYMYCVTKVIDGELLEYPMMGVEHFLEKYKGKYIVIGKKYRIFLKKICD